MVDRDRVGRARSGRLHDVPRGLARLPHAPAAETSSADGRVTISCLVSDLEYRWQLTADGERTRVQVHVDIPEVEAHRLETQTAAMSSALARLTRLAAASATR